MAIQENGAEAVFRHIGREPSGRPCSEMILDTRRTPHSPHNPLINAGAIMACSLIRTKKPLAERVKRVLETWSKLTGGTNVKVDQKVAKAESEYDSRNRCLAYMMQEARAFPEGANLTETLELYFQSCGIEQSCETLSVVAATLANGGVCPITQEVVFSQSTVRDCLSVMSTCGMYDYSGEFAFHFGIPAKSGVSGVIMMVVPNVMGVVTYAPRLNDQKNSIKGLRFAELLSQTFKLHCFDCDTGFKLKDFKMHKGRPTEAMISDMISAASHGDMRALTNFRSVGGVDLLNMGDYDGRTPLHLACAEGKMEVVQFYIALVEQGGQLLPLDRWGNTPVMEAQKSGHADVASALEAAIAKHNIRARPMTNLPAAQRLGWRGR